MSWMVLHIIGIIAYAASGAFVALAARYSFIGVYVLGLTTSFGGAVIRNLIIGIPISGIWDRFTILTVLITLTIIVLLPIRWIHHWKRWGLFFDSIGLASFAIQGALSAKQVHDSLGVIVLASMFTGVGGGMVRDLLAGRKPLALKEEIHAVLTMFCAVCIWLDWTNPIELTLMVIVVVVSRMFAIRYQWRIPLPCHRKGKLS
ncbi:trimeric intracellular cation channel family protein [Aneurinibacillus sp. Ricciae_BoGa-3]|uniref:trimeric intracellular cation channel family protein n=1 Tax=Aneurinibacillus sp. Ricciae_BoGa-3 TaxID=3022697 RepID=UPI0023421EE1|nr:trimeric intracellular cation channel family protein [Aneurinibacillus sp. Ricciae_BoGa-3]WCK53275.1 trimeric intracellular cation channel family protein [Aneurinibacillus sp. Ricciae_BoGa-3]